MGRRTWGPTQRPQGSRRRPTATRKTKIGTGSSLRIPMEEGMVILQATVRCGYLPDQGQIWHMAARIGTFKSRAEATTTFILAEKRDEEYSSDRRRKQRDVF